MPVSVTVAIICKDLTEGFSGGECTVPEGSSIGTTLEACLSEHGVEFTGDVEYLTVCLKNGRRALYSDVVEQDDMIHIVRKVYGG